MKSSQRRGAAARPPLVLAWIALFALWSPLAEAVVLDDDNVVTVVLNDGTQVVLYGEADTSVGTAPNAPPPNVQALAEKAVGIPDSRYYTSAAAAEQAASEQRQALVLKVHSQSRLPKMQYVRTQKYYYLPPGLHLSQRPDGTPEFLFLKFTTEARQDQGGVSGALLHFLVEWGLSAKQEQEVQAKLKAKVPNGRLVGAVPMETEGEAASFEIVSATLSDETMAPSVVTSGKAPLVPGGKAAVAARLVTHGAQLLAATFEETRSITDVSLAVNMAYTTLTPAAKGSITFNWSKLEAERTKLRGEYERTEVDEDTEWACIFFCFAWEGDSTYEYSYDEMREQFRFLEEKQVVHLEWLETRDDEKLNKIREAFFDYFVQSMANPVEQAPPEGEEEGPASPTIPGDAQKYTWDRQAFNAAFQRKISFFDLSVRLPVRRPLQVVGNLASWYDAVEDNEKCVASVNLNDPFFQHRDIHFILDLDAKEMFDQAVNYVTVNVRKNRTDGNPFQDHVTFDARYLEANGINATVSYARGEDDSSDLYEYQAQWSLRGGVLYPRNPPWQRGSWEGVTLAPPVVPRTIEVEGALDEMAAHDIARITVQIHYPKFGREVEENIAISPLQGQALVSKTIFIDRDAPGYAYRLILNHKTEGKLALPWSARVGDDYIYASIPPDLFVEGSTLREEAKSAAVDIVHSAKETVLDRFRELLGGGS